MSSNQKKWTYSFNSISCIRITFSDLAFSKDIFNEKGTLSFNVRDLFDSRASISEAFTETFYSESKYRWSSRSFTFNLTYRINQKKKRYQSGGQSYQGGGEEYGG